MKRLFLVPFSLALLTIQSQAQAGGIQFVVTAGNQVRVQHNELVNSVTALAADFSVDPQADRQTITGFGGAFNEQGWAALLALAETERRAVIHAIFSPQEANFTWGRIPIGASDYALERYTLAPVANDFTMSHFSLDRDRKFLIPYIQAAQAEQPGIKLWGSAWSPPVWMKDNGTYEAGNFIDSPDMYQAYALYLARFAEEYTKAGLPISAVAVQNEPTVVTGYPNGGWTPNQFQKFIRDYAGPLFHQRKLGAALWLGTLNEGDYRTFAKTVLDDPAAKKYVAAIGLQWDGDKQIPSLKRFHPDLPIIQTETDCGNWHWKPGFDKDHAQNDFKYAAYTWGRIRDYLKAGAQSYMLWNIVLDQDGKNIDLNRPWPQNSGIVINTASKTVTYTPMFRAFEHFTRYVPVGSVLLATQGYVKDLVAFRTPEAKTVLVLLNAGKAAKSLVGTVGGRTLAVELPPESFSTLILD